MELGTCALEGLGMSRFRVDALFWRGKRVFLTGHTGFKGSWLWLWLSELGAVTRGYALPPATTPSMFQAAGLQRRGEHVAGDIRDASRLRTALREFQPQIVIHMAAQALVRRSYREPLETFATNVQGTANLLDACRDLPGLRAVVIVTTDKCYENREWLWPYREVERLGGRDPYSASKACAEMVSAAYRQSYFTGGGTAVATARAGNVFGGGDYSEDRLIPDAVRAYGAGQPLVVRNPGALRPWQHVVDPLTGYLMLARALFEAGHEFALPYNFGPLPDQQMTVGGVIESFTRVWGEGARWVHEADANAVHEAGLLLLDSSRARAELGWMSQSSLDGALRLTADWYRALHEGRTSGELERLTVDQIGFFQGAAALRSAG
jgi:CDP-glucose 4,6-dehydratase